MSGHRWYVASIRPRFESKVADRLGAIGFGTFLPLATVSFIKPRYRWGRWYDETRKRQVVAFPTYLFVCFDIADPRWRLITQDRDVRLLFGPDPERPRPVPVVHMAALFRAAQDRAMDERQVQTLIELGIAYRVTDGPFTGHVGPAEADHGETVQLGLSLFGRPMPIRLPVGQVEKAGV
jgi:transcription antitermination factor NusG